MKKLYLILALPLNIMAMDGVRFSFESGTDWGDQKTFESAWTDHEKMEMFEHDFKGHVPAIFAHRMQKMFEEHGDCACFTTRNACDRLKKSGDQQLMPLRKREIPRLRSLLGEQQPNAQGALIYTVLRKISFAAAKQLAGKHFLINDAIKTFVISSVMNVSLPPLQADEKRVLEEKIFPQLDETDVAGIKELVASMQVVPDAKKDEIKD